MIGKRVLGRLRYLQIVLEIKTEVNNSFIELYSAVNSKIMPDAG